MNRISMKHNKEIAIGLFTLAAILILKDNEPGIGKLSRERRKRINDAYSGLKRYFERKYSGAKTSNASTGSKYYIFKDGNTKVKVRRGTHGGKNGTAKFTIEADLYNLTKEGATAQQAYNKAKDFIVSALNNQ